MSYQYSSGITRSNYPPSVYHKKQDHVELTIGPSEKRISVTAISKREKDAIMEYGQIGCKPLTATGSIGFAKSGKGILIKGVKLHLANIEQIVPATYSSRKDKLMSQKIIGGKNIFYNYGGKFFDYYGCNFQEAGSAWETIKTIASLDEYCLIYSHA